MNRTKNFAWNAFAPLGLALLLSWTYLPSLSRLVDPALSPVQKLIVVAGLGGAVYFWYFYFFRTLPWLAFDRRVDSAWARSDWEAVISRIQTARKFGRDGNGWTSSLGMAKAHLERWEDALSEFAEIEGPLDNPEHEYGRYLVTSSCLYNLGRIDEAREVFVRLDAQDWPESMSLHMDDLRARLDGSDPNAETCH